VRWPSTPAAPGAAATSRFFGHCFGRQARASASNRDGRRPPLATVEASAPDGDGGEGGEGEGEGEATRTGPSTMAVDGTERLGA
jgi:hypothetical protein